MKYYLIAGERSGDLHGGNLIAELKKLDDRGEFRGFGGEQMSGAGMHLKRHYRDLAFMGFLEVLFNLHKISGFLKEVKSDILAFNPDVVILIDYGGFNLKVAKFLKKRNIKVYYYITPKVWAWNQGRANKIKRLVDRMFVILPFERDFYLKYDWEVDYVGNPVLDAIKKHQADKLEFDSDLPVVAVLPGSRKQEVANVLHVIREVIVKNSNYLFVIAKVDNLDATLYTELNDLDNVRFIEGRTYDLLLSAKAAIVTSGTATLETALLKIPQVVVYKTSMLSYLIGKRLIKVNYISLVNLIANKPVVRELIQDDFNSVELDSELQQLLSNQQKRKEILDNYSAIKNLLDVGSASENTAKLMNKYLST